MFWTCYGTYTGKKDIRAFIEYAKSVQKSTYEEYIYRVYVASAMRELVMAQAFKRIPNFVELLKPGPTSQSSRSGNDIVEDVIKNAGLEVE